ncbi:MAG: LL-diaminopimelate aminotransferase [Alphaproteobacteria bacterium]|nr:LL-diaminopimelate aminotransferase [Alphaproteobacteria bacterium]MCL2505567.1 LL-diaminopimelate aminotransferase [Alphaproteobacteria bacterium]
MAFVNENFFKLSPSYLFSEIAKRVSDFKTNNPDKADSVIRCGIGDVTEPLPAASIKALHKAVDEMAVRETFRGYGPEEGYEFLRHAVAENDYRSRNLSITDDEIFVSDGSKCDCGNILDILGKGNRIAIPDPVYPVYYDTNIMAGNEDIIFVNGTEDNGFVPEPPFEKVDVIYLCFPNNPTGAVATKEQLKSWVDYALKNKSLIIFDAAYGDYIRNPDIPRSIYEIEGAYQCAIETRSFSKSGGFTGLRCAFAVVPKALTAYSLDGEKSVSLHSVWKRRQGSKFNGVSYPVQRAAEALYSKEGQAEVRQLVDFYMNNAKIIAETLRKLGLPFWGGDNAPYIWTKTIGGKSSWDMFSFLLDNFGIVTTPGSGFGKMGEGYFRISAFNSLENIKEAAKRLSSL